MGKIFKVSVVFFIGLSTIVSSCKKEDNTPVAINGCTDSSAMNYLSNATSNDNSCIFAYNIAQGIWNIFSACEDFVISIPVLGEFPVPLNDIFSDTIVEITGEQKTAAIVNLAEKNKKNLNELTMKELNKIEPKLTNDVLKVFDLKNSVNSKKSYGGTAFANIKKMIVKYKKQL